MKKLNLLQVTTQLVRAGKWVLLKVFWPLLYARLATQILHVTSNRFRSFFFFFENKIDLEVRIQIQRSNYNDVCVLFLLQEDDACVIKRA